MDSVEGRVMTRDEVLAKIRVEKCAVYDLEGNCWNYYGRWTSRGYASAFIDGHSRLLHRYFYEQVIGDIPDGMTLDHLCQTKHCVNPFHMEPVTPGENLRRFHSPPYKLRDLDREAAEAIGELLRPRSEEKAS